MNAENPTSVPVVAATLPVAPNPGSGSVLAPDRVHRLVKADPMLALGLLTVLTQEQWRSIVDGDAYTAFRDGLVVKAKTALRKYPLPAAAMADDVACDVLLRLCEGAGLKAYKPEKTPPGPYLLGCAYHLSRVAARSAWRQYLRDRGLPAMKPKPKTLPAAPARLDAA